MKKIVTAALCICLLLAAFGCGAQAPRYTPVSGLDTNEKVTLTIAIPYETNKALNSVANAFMTKYPNVSIHLQYVEDYDTNAVQLFKNDKLDMILQKSIVNNEYTVTDPETKEKQPTGTWPEDYFYNFAADTEIDFSGTSSDITDNYRHRGTDKAGNEIEYIYSYPLGGETRGVFVNKTLLDAYGLAVPAHYEALLDCCKALKAAGLVPIQGGVSTAAYSLGLAPAVNPVVHDESALSRMAAAKPGVSELFTDTVQKFYTLATSRYFDYKAVEESGYFTQTSELGQAQSFLGLQTDDATFEVTKPENNVGYVAFMPYISSMGTVISALIDEYDLATEFVFICSPLNDEGSDPSAYITPYYGICANKNSANLLWVREFINYLFQHDTITAYAEEAGVIPNASDAMRFAAAKYGLNVDTDIALCGQILFSDDYNGFEPLSASLLATLKCSAPKYMVDLHLDANGAPQYETDEDGRAFLYLGNGETKVYKEYVGEADPARPGYAFCTLAYYLDNMESEFASYRVN